MFATTQLPSSAGSGEFMEEAELAQLLYSGLGYRDQGLGHFAKCYFELVFGLHAN